MLTKICKFRSNKQLAVRSFSKAKVFKDEDYFNISNQIWDLTKRKLLKIPNHPLAILTTQVQDFFENHQISSAKP